MYSLVLLLHSWLRWVAFVTGGLAINALRGPGNPSRAAAADKWSLAFMMTLDVQMLLGLVLYLVLSPNTAAMFADFPAAMRDPAARFWAVEHVTAMLFSVVIVHVGRVLGRKATSPAAKQGRMLLCFVAAIIAMLAATPWPGMPSGRPLFRFGL